MRDVANARMCCYVTPASSHEWYLVADFFPGASIALRRPSFSASAIFCRRASKSASWSLADIRRKLFAIALLVASHPRICLISASRFWAGSQIDHSFPSFTSSTPPRLTQILLDRVCPSYVHDPTIQLGFGLPGTANAGYPSVLAVSVTNVFIAQRLTIENLVHRHCRGGTRGANKQNGQTKPHAGRASLARWFRRLHTLGSGSRGSFP